MKLIATICVISWSGFWAFGYLALTAGIGDGRQMTVAAILAALGLFSGIFTYLKLARSTDPERWKHVKQSEGA
jgi:hypothetical protein